MPQLRQNIITGEWVVIAPERAKRPSDFMGVPKVAPKTTGEQNKESPFAVGSRAWKNRLKEFDTKTTFVIPNLYPAFVCDKEMCSTRSYYPEKGFYRSKEAVGDHDVVVVKDADLTLYDFPQNVWEDLLSTFQVRHLAHSRNRHIEHVMGIYNHGPQSGASIAHPHAQIFAAPIVPNYIEKELEGAARYFNNNGVNVFSDLFIHERHEKIRLLAANEHFLAFTFYAARFPFETWVLPARQRSHFAAISKSERSALARILRRVLSMHQKTLGSPSMNAWIHSSPATMGEVAYYTWHIELAPRVVGYGGYELGSGVVIDIMSPEEAAKYLRRHDKQSSHRA